MRREFFLLLLFIFNSCALKEKVGSEPANCKSENIHHHTCIVSKTYTTFSHSSKGHSVSVKMWIGRCIACNEMQSARYGYIHKGKAGYLSFETCGDYCPKKGDTVYYNLFNVTKKFQ